MAEFEKVAAERTAELDQEINRLQQSSNDIARLLAARDLGPEAALAMDNIISDVDIQDIDAEIGIGPDFVQALIDAQGDKDAIDAAYDQDSFRQRALVEIQNVVQNQRDIQTGIDNFEADLLIAERQGLSPPLAPDLPPTLEAIYADAFAIGMENLDDGFLSPQQAASFDESVDLFLAAPSDVQNDWDFAGVAQLFGFTNVSALKNTMLDAAALAQEAKEDAASAFEKTEFTSGDYAFPYAVRAALMDGLQLDFETASAWGNSYRLRQLMEAKSGGVVNYEAPEGNQKGLFGLPEELYDNVGGWDAVKDDAAAQIMIAFRYIQEVFGDPNIAYDTYVKNPSIWGT